MSSNMKPEKNNQLCFSKTNFNSVYQFILIKTQHNKTKEYIHGDWEIVVSDSSELLFKKKDIHCQKLIENGEFFRCKSWVRIMN